MSIEVRLAEFVRAEMGRPFVWGHTNCVALALRALDALHDTDLHARYGLNMSSLVRAAVWARRHGLEGLRERFVAEGFAVVPTAYAQPGDILLGHTEDGQIAAHVCLGVRVLSSSSEGGIFQVRQSDILPAPLYAVGRRTG